MIYIGIDNGPSGSIGVLSSGPAQMFLPVTERILNYTQKKAYTTLLNFRKMKRFFWKLANTREPIMLAMERPMINPGRWSATCVALRVHQQYLDMFSALKMGEPMSLDSRKWQKKFLPSGVKGPELKPASEQVGLRMFPQCRAEILKHKDADGLFIALWLKQEMQ